MPKVKWVLGKTSGLDGFLVELEDGDIIHITGVQWFDAGNKRVAEGKFLFRTSSGKEIIFSKEQIEAAYGLK